jgi:hypothetical protein
MTGYPVLEHGTTRKTRWFRANRFRIALAIAIVETILIVANVLSWFLAIGIATLVFALYLVVRRKVRNPTVRQVAWTAALSQTVPVLIPLLLVLATTIAIVTIAIFALVMVVLLLIDRR